PYRPKLTDEEAFAILRERRAVMYDPLIVDTFIRVHAEIASETISSTLPRGALNEITSSTYSTTADVPHPTGSDKASGRADEALALYELDKAVRDESGVPLNAENVMKQLQRLVPFSQSVLFLYDTSTDELIAQHVFGNASALLKGIRVPLGQRLSG